MSAAPVRQTPFWYHRALCPEGTSEAWFEELFRAIDRSLPFERDLRFVPTSQWAACRARSTRAKKKNDFVREFPVYSECHDELHARWLVRRYLADLCLDKLLDIEEDAETTANAAYQAGQRAYEERKAWVETMRQKREKEGDDEEEEEEECDETAESEDDEEDDEDDEELDKELVELRAKLQREQAELQQLKAEVLGMKRKREDTEMRLAATQAAMRPRPASV